MGEDDVPRAFTQVDRWGGEVMARLEDGWCAALDRETLRCTIYARRPTICRDFELAGDECLEVRAAHPVVFHSAKKEDPGRL